MEKCESMSHVRWECKYHIVFIPKYRRDEATVRRYIREQDNWDQGQGQLFD